MAPSPSIKTHCLYDKLVKPESLVFHPDNANDHPPEQIERLAEILEYQGWRYAVKVSKRSGFITTGHGRVLAALSRKWKSVPVVYQDYENSDQELADVHADNAIASWAVMNLAKVNQSIEKLGPEFNIEMLGLKDFALDISDKIDAINRGDENSEWVDMPEFKPGDGYIKLIYIFPSNESREAFVKDKEIKITMKKSDQWIVHVT